MCIYNRMMINRKYIKNKKNGGQVPAVPDQRVLYVPIGCGNCMECRKQKAREWQIRLSEDIKTNTNGKFIGLTFSNESIKQIMELNIKQTDENGYIKEKPIKELTGYKLDNTIATKGVRLFLERWRKEFGKSLRHWFITELGHNGTENIHLHGIIWTNEKMETVERIWKYGWLLKGRKKHLRKNVVTYENWVNGATINYMVKYITKRDFKHKEYKGIILSSAGIGKNYINTKESERNKFNGEKTKTTYKTSTGHEMPIPIYWRNKIYTDREREKLWLQQLDKEIRYVDGIKVDISKTDEIYKKLTQEARKKNKELGYGGIPNENRKDYEEKRRELMIETRIRKNMPPAG